MRTYGIKGLGGMAFIAILLLVEGCSVGSASAPRPTATAVSRTASTPPCPHSDGGDCLGRLAGGLYRTTLFEPRLTYRVPSGGWGNDDDSSGSFMLLAPGYSIGGVDSGTSDFIVAVSAVAAATDCNFTPVVGSDTSPGTAAQAIARSPGLSTSRPAHVTIGGLHGFVIDVRVKKSWHRTCPASSVAQGGPATAILTGRDSPQIFSWAVDPGSVNRVYLLRGPLFTLGILINDAKDAGHLATYSRIVQSFQFKT